MVCGARKVITSSRASSSAYRPRQAAGSTRRQAELASGDQVHQRVPLEHRDIGRAADLRDQRVLHRRAGGVRHVHDAPGTVAAFAREVQLAVFQGERHTQAPQPFDALRRVFDHEARGIQLR
jgi:hypothetical protein